jgi:hypothetical protein
MSYTTSINELPTDPTGGGSIEGNIGLIANETIRKENNPNPNVNANANISLEQSTINQIISGLQQASATGATSLPSRDIPNTTSQITQDPYIQPNYIPPETNNKYINELETPDDMIRRYNKNNVSEDSLDNLYNQIQIPLLLAILYFIFQLPIFKNTLFKYLPILFNSDGNINFTGLIFTSIMFGSTYFILSKTMLTLSSF